MTPILLDSTAGCPGVRDPIKGRARAICHTCARFGEPGPQIAPEAALIGGGEWFCPQRRFGGTHFPDASVAAIEGGVGTHGDSVRPETEQGPSLPVGGCCVGRRTDGGSNG